MEQKFFRSPFASNGDTQTIPDTATSDGSVSYPSGWGPDYARDPATDANAKPVEREAMNAVLNAITVAIRQYQTDAFPEWITPANNGGTAYPYGEGVIVRHRQGEGDFISYVSLSSNNTAEPGTDATKWQGFIFRRASQDEADEGTNATVIITPPTLQQSLTTALNQMEKQLAPYLLPVGVALYWGGDVPPDGWLEGNGQEFDPVKNPKLLAIHPSGRVPDYRDRFIVGGYAGSLLVTGEATDLTHYHNTGMFLGLTGNQSDDVSFPIRGENWYTETYVGGGTTGERQKPLRINIPNEASGQTISTSNPRWLASLESPVMPELRPKHISMMVIIKTDQADTIAQNPTPTNIIVSPSVLTIGIGGTQQFSAQVLPVNLSDDFPVTWLSTDTDVGTIDNNGLFTAVGSGNTDIIVSVSSGLSVRVTVRVVVLLTSVNLGAIPDLVSGNSYSLAVTKYPTSATEDLIFESVDNAVASTSSDGVLHANGEGTSLITVKGSVSGVNASQTVNVTDVSVAPEFLAIANNLSEIAEVGAAAQAEARDNLGLGGLATKDALTAADVGAVPQAPASLETEDLNTVLEPGRKFQALTSNATLETNYPVALAGMLDVIKTTATGIRQTYYPYNNADVYYRNCIDVDADPDPVVFSEWVQQYNASNLDLNGDKFQGRLLRVVKFETDGTYTPAEGVSAIIVEACGGGGAGGSVGVITTGKIFCGGGANAGAYAKSYYSRAELPDDIPITIGAGGVSVENLDPDNAVTNSAGGTTSFGNLINCQGGAGGTGQLVTPPYIGGNPSHISYASGGNIINTAGAHSNDAIVLSEQTAQAGSGGFNALGSKNADRVSSGAGLGLSAQDVGYGSGGSGALNRENTSDSFLGGSGSQGVVIIYEYS